NRRPVDYARRIADLEALTRDFAGKADRSVAARQLLDHWTDGRVKLWVMWRILELRRQHPRWFEDAGYLALATRGAKAAHLCAFARPHDAGMLVTLAPRLYAGLGDDDGSSGDSVWGDTRVMLPRRSPQRWRNALTGAHYSAPEGDDLQSLHIASILDAFPLALLVSEWECPTPSASGRVRTDGSA